MFAIKFSMEKWIKKIWVAGFFLPTINATVFSLSSRFIWIHQICHHPGYINKSSRKSISAIQQRELKEYHWLFLREIKVKTPVVGEQLICQKNNVFILFVNSKYSNFPKCALVSVTAWAFHEIKLDANYVGECISYLEFYLKEKLQVPCTQY